MRLGARHIPADESTEQMLHKANTGKHRFLIVDDEQDVLDSVRRLFRRDYTIHLALGAQRAFEILETEDIHLVMSDQRMPEMTGVDFLSRVRERHPKVVRMLFTGYGGDVNAVIDAINQGSVYRYIHKPFDPAELKITVAQAVERFELTAEREVLLQQLAERNTQLEAQHADLTQAYQELKSLDRLKSLFMQVVSHELNTPTAVILGYASLLVRPNALTDQAAIGQALAGIKKSGLRLKAISSKISTMLAANEPSLKLHLTQFDVGDLVTEVAEELAPALAMRQQVLTLDLESASLIAERSYVRDLLTNLVVNAIKFSPDDQTIWVSAKLDTTSDKTMVVLAVRDDGVGIAPDDRDRVFEAFFGTYQSQHHSSGDFGFQKRGIGLGLAIVKRFAELHGGRVELDTELGQGSTFRVYLPQEPDGPNEWC